jgi:hypothetical protein
MIPEAFQEFPALVTGVFSQSWRILAHMRTCTFCILFCAAVSLKAEVVTSQVNIPLNIIVPVKIGSVSGGVFSDQVKLSGSMNLMAEIIPSGPSRIISTLVDVRGTSLLSGISYQADGTSAFSIPPMSVARGGITLTASYRIGPADPLGAFLGLRGTVGITLPISVGLSSNGQMSSARVPSAGVLWAGNNSSALPTTGMATDTSGSILGSVSASVSGIAFDGANLWYSDAFGNLTMRTPDGNTVLASFQGAAVANNADMAWDNKRGRLWRAESSPPALERINPATGAIEATVPLPLGSANDSTYPRAAIGVAYDSATDRIYVSFCKVGCSTLGGVVAAFDAGTGAPLGDLFSTSAYTVGGLAFDPVGGDLWVGLWNGFNPVIANMTLDGVVKSSFSRGGPFVDGLELVESASTK